jgi:hypothetical protein
MSGQRHNLINEAIAEAKRIGICEGLEMAAAHLELGQLRLLAEHIRALKPPPPAAPKPCATCGGSQEIVTTLPDGRWPCPACVPRPLIE